MNGKHSQSPGGESVRLCPEGRLSVSLLFIFKINSFESSLAVKQLVPEPAICL